jgi:hypothetical protein
MKHLVIACSTMKEEVNRFKADGISFIFLEQSLHLTPRKMKEVTSIPDVLRGWGNAVRRLQNSERSGRNIGWPATGYNDIMRNEDG